MAKRSFNLPDELDALLVARAAELDRDLSWVIVKALESALGERPSAGQPAVSRKAAGSTRTPAFNRATNLTVSKPRPKGWKA